MKTQQILHLPSPRLLTLSTALAAIGFFSAGTASLMASSVTWNGANSANWNLAGNWTSALPVTGDSLTFGAAGTSGAVLNNDLTTIAFAIAGITFTSDAPAYTISGNALTLTGGITNNSSATQTFGNTLGLDRFGQSLIARSGNLVMQGVLSGTRADTMLTIGDATASTGTVTLNGNNTFAGGVALSYATLNIGNAGALGSGTLSAVNANAKFDNTTGSALTVSNGLKLSSNLTFVGSNDMTFGGVVTIASSKTLAVNANTLTLNGGVVFTNMLSKGGAGTLVLNGAGSGSGNLQISQGTLVLGNSAAAGTGTIMIATNAVLASNTDLSGANKVNNAVSITGDGIIGGSSNIEFGGNFTNTTGNSRSLTISNSAVTTIGGNIYLNNTSTTNYGLTIKGTGNLVVNGAIANYNGDGGVASGGLTLTNTGKVTLAGNNTYTGNTTVSNGTLAVNGSIAASSAVTVSSAATLAGTGTVGGATTLQGTLAAGDGGIGTLNTGNLTLAATSVLDVELGRNGATATSDLTNVTGSVNIVSGANLKLTLATGLSNLAGGDIIFLVNNDTTDAVVGTFTSLNGTTTTLSEGSTFTWNAQTLEITYKADSATSSFTGGNDIALLVVPEPATWSMIMGGLGLMAFAQRARRRMSR